MNSNGPITMRAAGGAGVPALLADYYELAKPSIVWLILMSTAMGCYLAVDGSLPVVPALHALVATALLAAGTGGLNQWWERGIDARMRRTAARPLPAGRVSPQAALAYASGLTIAGLAYLLAGVNDLSFWLGAATVVSYNFIYTPLKTRTWWSTAVGAFPGAVPPLMGWAALRGSLDIEAWVLFGILFLWQFPHFYAIAWMYREDYARAGIRML
ncbi:MAG: heme o synthase, partial [Bryobacterales bacterium]|nr:heme o synthase [Bryobacterales bacterium]